MHILVIGAGLTGLACARRLTDLGHTVTVIDKGRGVGGRLATRRLGDAAFDTGAQFMTARDPAFAAEIIAAGATIWSDGFPELGGAVLNPDGHARYVMPGGMNSLAKHLAQGLQILDQRTVIAVREATVNAAHHWDFTCVAGDRFKTAEAAMPAEESIMSADAIVLTSPVPQAIDLLTASGIAVPAAVQAVRYDPCLCLLLDFPEAASALLEAPGGFKVTDDPAITWIASQRAKGVRLALNEGRGDGLVIHTSGAWSSVRYALTETQILDQLMPAAMAILNRCGITHIPARAELKKWKYSLPTITVPESCVVLDTRLPLILAGDAFGNRPRVEGAWCSGIAAALTLDHMPQQHAVHNRNS